MLQRSGNDKGLSLKDSCLVGNRLLLNIQNLKDGICTNIAYKNPRQQAYLAAKILLEYLMKRQKPLEEVVYVNSEIVFRSNVHVYE